jgi:peptidoglycan hydrolase-like protein with peptidoglycan-binding domain
VDFPDYPRVTATADPTLIKAMQCLLKEQKAYAGRLTGTLNTATLAAISAWQKAHGLHVGPSWSRRAWMSLLATGQQPVLKFGSTGPSVRDLQRTLNAATMGTDLPVNGLFGPRTDLALRAWQIALNRNPSGVATPSLWAALASGLRA